MAEEAFSNGNHAVVLNVKEGDANHTSFASKINHEAGSFVSMPFMQKLIAEAVGMYFLIFAGCAAMVVNMGNDKVVTVPGISIVWGLAVTILSYSTDHISGAHFNTAVTIAFATCKRFPWKQVPAYVFAQLLGSTMASGTLRLIFNGHENYFAGTVPSGSDVQSFVLEFIVTFYLMFVISGVATDNRAIGELAGLAVGSPISLNVMFEGVEIEGEIQGVAASRAGKRISHLFLLMIVLLSFIELSVKNGSE